MKTSPINPTGSFSSIRVIRGHALVIQQRKDDREQFVELMIQLRCLATRADNEQAEYYRRNLIQQADRMGEEKCVVKV